MYEPGNLWMAIWHASLKEIWNETYCCSKHDVRKHVKVYLEVSSPQNQWTANQNIIDSVFDVMEKDI